MPAGFIGEFESHVRNLISFFKKQEAAVVAAFVQLGFRHTDKLGHPADGIGIGRGNGFDDVLGIGRKVIDDEAVCTRQLPGDF